MRFVLMIGIALLPTGAMAGTKQDVMNAVAFRLTTAYQCAPLTGDKALYERLKAKAPDELAKVGVDQASASLIISSIESQKQDSNGALTKQLCQDLLKK